MRMQASDAIPKAALEQLREPLQQTRTFAQSEVASLAEGFKQELVSADSRMSSLEEAMQSVASSLTQVAEEAETAASVPYSELAMRLSEAESQAAEIRIAADQAQTEAEVRAAAAEDRIATLEGVVASLQGLLRAGSESQVRFADCDSMLLTGCPKGSPWHGCIVVCAKVCILTLHELILLRFRGCLHPNRLLCIVHIVATTLENS